MNLLFQILHWNLCRVIMQNIFTVPWLECSNCRRKVRGSSLGVDDCPGLLSHKSVGGIRPLAFQFLPHATFTKPAAYSWMWSVGSHDPIKKQQFCVSKFAGLLHPFCLYYPPNVMRVIKDGRDAQHSWQLFMHNLIQRNLRGKENLGELGVDGKVILKGIKLLMLVFRAITPCAHVGRYQRRRKTQSSAILVRSEFRRRVHKAFRYHLDLSIFTSYLNCDVAQTRK